jgi:hypothetical protein
VAEILKGGGGREREREREVGDVIPLCYLPFRLGCVSGRTPQPAVQTKRDRLAGRENDTGRRRFFLVERKDLGSLIFEVAEDRRTGRIGRMPAGRTEDVSWEESLRDSRGATTPQHGKGIHASDLEWRASGGAHQQTNRHHHRSQSAGPGKPLRSGDVSNRRAGSSSGGAGSGSWGHGGSSNLPQKTPRAAANEAIQRAPTETLLRWVRSNGVSVTTLDELKDGVGLCDIIRRLEPTAPLTGLNRKAKSRAAIVTNLELALQVCYTTSSSSHRTRAMYLVGRRVLRAMPI